MTPKFEGEDLSVKLFRESHRRAVFKTNKLILILFYLNCVHQLGSGYVFDACELANELVQVHQMQADEVPDWICLIYTESSFRTTALGPVGRDKSRDYGLFQINSFYWCNSSHPAGSFNVCNQNCVNYLDDDLSNDLECARLIHSIHGFRAWLGYTAKCSDGISRIVFDENCDQVPTTDSPLIQYIAKSRPLDERPQLPDYTVKRDYSPFVFRDELLKRRAAKKRRKQENNKKMNSRKVAAPMDELESKWNVNREEANERTQAVQAAASRRPDETVIGLAMMTTNKPNKIKKQLLDRKQPPTSLKNNLANFRAGSASSRSSESATRVAKKLAGGSFGPKLDKQRCERFGQANRRRNLANENNCATDESRGSSKQSFETNSNARKFNLIKWTTAVVVTPALAKRQPNSRQENPRVKQSNRKQSNRTARQFLWLTSPNYKSSKGRPALFVKRFGIDF